MDEVADIFDRLAVGLGFGDGYVVQGGDIGSKIGRIIAAKHSSCKGMNQSTSSRKVTCKGR